MASDFNKEMSHYLSKRIGSSASDGDEKPKKAEFKEIDEFEEDLDQVPQTEMDGIEEEAEISGGFFGRLFKSLGLKREGIDEQNDEEFEESYPELEEDVKKVLRITFDWINQLPSETKIKFKNSQDFVEYKAILQKYGLVKEKKEV